jgi:hypothetical protein
VADLNETYSALRLLMLENASPMEMFKDVSGDIQFNAPWNNPRKPKERMWFGGVALKKAFVSYHLMPIYNEPELSMTISDDLRKRMQGKSCFNFKHIDIDLFAELAELTQRSAKAFSSPKDVC